MLNFLRQSVAGWVAKIFLGLLVASFAVWGVDDIFLSGPSQAVAQIGDTKISPQQFANAFQRAVNRATQERQQPVTTEQARAEGLDQQVLGDLVNRALYQEAAAKLGLAVPDEVVAREVRNMDQFKNDLGEFERFRFDNLIRENGYSEKQFFALVRQEMLREQIVRAVLGGVRSPQTYTETILTHRGESRTADYIVIPADTVSVPAPTQEQLASFHQDNAARFTAPEYRAMTWVPITTEALIDEIAVSDAEIEEAYADRQAAYSSPEMRDIEQLVFDSEEQAAAARARIVAGESIIAVGSELQNMSEDDILLRNQTADALPAPLNAIAFGLKSGEVSAPIETGFGYTLVRVRTITPGTVKPLAAVRQELRDSLARDRALDAMYDIMERFEDERGGGTALDEAAKSLGLPVNKIEAVSINGVLPSGDLLSGLPVADAMLSTLFDMELDEESGLIDTPDGGFVAIRLDNINESHLTPLDDIREEVTAAWKADQRIALLAAEAEKLAQRAKSQGLAAVAVSLGVDVKITGDLRRYDARDENGQTSPVSASLRYEIFGDEIEKGSVVHGPGRDGYLLAEVTAVKIPTAKDAPVQYEQLRNQLSRSFAVDMLIGYQGSLEEQLGYSVYPATIDATIGGADNGLGQ